MSTRGVRNNNPANIRLGSKWRGMTETQTDKAFCQFKNMTWGVRALIALLRTYVKKYHLHTIPEIITRFAPPSDGNNTAHYIDFVNSYCKHVEDDKEFYLTAEEFSPLAFSDSGDLFNLCQAICYIESGFVLRKDTFTAAFALL